MEGHPNMLRSQSLKLFISRSFNPYRVFIALMIAVLIWLFPSVIPTPQPKSQPIENGVILPAAPYSAAAYGPCSNVRCDPGFCCLAGSCVLRGQCGSGEDPL